MKKIGGLAIALILCACASKPTLFHKYTQPSQTQNPQPDSLRAKIELEFQNPEESGSLSGTLFAVPGQRYRMELRGPFGISAASIFWKDSLWNIIIPREEVIWNGQGHTIPTPLPGLRSVNIHQLVSASWGDILPSGWETAQKRLELPKEVWTWACEEKTCIVDLDPKTGQVLRLQQKTSQYTTTVLFEEYRQEPPFVIPSKITFQGQDSRLTLHINSVDYKPSWRNKLWTLRKPASFQNVDFTQPPKKQ